MPPEDHGHTGECACIDHHLRAKATFFGRLEDQHHVALRERILQQRRCAQHHGHMSIVPAGVHFPAMARSKRQAGLFGNR
ncbi:MAG: hypothetical protein AW09_004435 [Candidatus Accumulibacter phosphatis]|uniref:Uncharacterized protein n=1 Tax=Candidatus Accumulibacter phosphatis TaxID=327160 RepID=A0A084Y6X2_9PROT|nr:MAG: hypothetical protein AW09_004435 [Candidatus Accumulibacter phosphatis]